MELGKVLVGHLDGIANGRAWGWAWDPTGGEEAVEVDLYRKGELVTRKRADQPRADLAREEFGTGAYGFTFDLGDTAPEEIEVRFARNGTALPGKPMQAFCQLPFNQLKVAPNGDMSNCCYQSGVLGNILTDPFEDVWLGRKAKEVRDFTADSKLHPMCNDWGCPFMVEPMVNSHVPLLHAYPHLLDFYLPNTHCNIGGTQPTPATACFMCPRAVPEFIEDPDYTAAIAERLRPWVPFLWQIRIQGVAEPFWKGRMFEVLEMLNFGPYRKRILVHANTNGTVFTPERQRRMVEFCPKATLSISLDAATPETYVSVRRLDLFERACEHIEQFMKIKLETQEVYTSNNLNLRNLHEAVEMVRLAKRLGVKAVTFNPTSDANLPLAELKDTLVSPENAHLFRKAQEEIMAESARIQMPVLITRRLDMGIVGGF